MSGNSTAITTSSYATSACKHMGAVKKLIAMDTTLALNLLLSMADALHTDLDATCKMCGTPCDNSIPTFKLLDEALFPLIEAREKPASLAADLPEVPKRWTLKDADVGCIQDRETEQAATRPDVPPEAGVGEKQAAGQTGIGGRRRRTGLRWR